MQATGGSSWRNGLGSRVCLLAAVLAAMLPKCANSLAWRIFSTTPDCVTTYVPKQQWSDALLDLRESDSLGLTLDYGFMASSTKNGVTGPAHVDVWVVDPSGRKVHTQESISDEEVSLTFDGGIGPWKLCFQQTSDNGRWRPSAQILLSYFNADVTDLKSAYARKGMSPTFGGEFGDADAFNAGMSDLPRTEHVDELLGSLISLDHHLHQLEREQKHFQHRTEWHLTTLQHSHRVMLWWGTAQVAGMVVAGGCQVAFIRNLFTPTARSMYKV